MIRAGSMLVAEALQRSMFGRTFILNEMYMPFCARQIYLASLFSDELQPNTRHLHPFSVQHLMEIGTQFGIAEGEWFGGGTIAAVYERVVSRYCQEQIGMAVYVAPPGLNTIYAV